MQADAPSTADRWDVLGTMQTVCAIGAFCAARSGCRKTEHQ
jgi:hypothetical protein